jgi:hypothetical protein
MVIVQAVISRQKTFRETSQAHKTEKFIVHRLQKIKNRKTLLTCGKLKVIICIRQMHKQAPMSLISPQVIIN